MFDLSSHHAVFKLYSGEGMSGVTSTDGFGVELGKADVPNIALLNQIADRADGIFDRNCWIPAHLIQIDAVGLQSLQ